MSRDHEKLEVFHDSHHLTLRIYRFTKDFPRDESFGLPQVTNFANQAPEREVELITRRVDNEKAQTTRFRPKKPGVVMRPV